MTAEQRYLSSLRVGLAMLQLQIRDALEPWLYHGTSTEIIALVERRQLVEEQIGILERGGSLSDLVAHRLSRP